MMKKTVPAVMVTTREALFRALDDGCTALHIELYLFSRLRAPEVDRITGRGYAFAGVGNSGVIFVRTEGPGAFDPERHEIADPRGIL